MVMYKYNRLEKTLDHLRCCIINSFIRKRLLRLEIKITEIQLNGDGFVVTFYQHSVYEQRFIEPLLCNVNEQ